MFTKADYLNYLYVLSEKERDMMAGLHRLQGLVADEALALQLRTLLQEKQESYEGASLLFGRLFGLAADQRRYKRSPALGDVKLRNLESGETASCHCLDISLGGLCVQLAAELPPGCGWRWKSGFSNHAVLSCAGARSDGAAGLPTGGTGPASSLKRARQFMAAK